MATTEERMKILKMIQEGKISADEGAQLLKALGASDKKARLGLHRKPRPSGARWLRVRVSDMHSGKSKVNVNLPLSLVDAGLNIASQFTSDVEMDDLATAVTDAIEDGLVGKIVDVVDDEDGKHIEVFIE
jgi:predicted DNA-binding ArsR family transcriptional regulator